MNPEEAVLSIHPLKDGAVSAGHLCVLLCVCDSFSL